MTKDISVHTERLILNSLQKEDLNNFLELQTNPEVRKFLGGPVSLDKAQSKFKDSLKAIPPTYHFAIRDHENKFIGIITLDGHHDKLHIKLSYQLLPIYWGQGFALEASKAIIDYAQKIFGFSNILAETQAKNTRSIKLLKKLGMELKNEMTRFGEAQVVYSCCIQNIS